MKYGFIGCGNMGGAIAKALGNSTTDIMISDPSDSAKEFASTLGYALGTNSEVVSNCSCVFLAVKPQVLADVLLPLREQLQQAKPTIISMAAGIQIQKIEEMIGAPLPIIRIMPNTPVQVGKGTILYCTNTFVRAEELNAFLADMGPCGTLDAIPEKLIDAGSALSGCGPAYVYMFIEAMSDGAVACGIPRDKALQYAANTVIGAASMVLETNKHPGALKDAVCSPGGSTIAGVKTLEENNFRSAVIEGIISAYKRTVELGK